MGIDPIGGKAYGTAKKNGNTALIRFDSSSVQYLAKLDGDFVSGAFTTSGTFIIVKKRTAYKFANANSLTGGNSYGSRGSATATEVSFSGIKFNGHDVRLSFVICYTSVLIVVLRADCSLQYVLNPELYFI